METQILHIEKIVFGGLGLGHIDNKVCFVPFVLPGELVQLERVRVKKSFYQARLRSLVKASPHRQSAPCPVYTQCGGCVYQHMDYADELRFKQNQLEEIFYPLLKKDTAKRLHHIIPSSQCYHYRNSVRRTYCPQKNTYGFVSYDRTTVVPIDDCLLAQPPINDTLKQRCDYDGAEKPSVVKTNPLGDISMDGPHPAPIRTFVGGREFQYDATVFFQGNLSILERMIAMIKERIPQGETFLDLYAGVGIFALSVAERFDRIVCVEENTKAIQFLEKNMRMQELSQDKIFLYNNRVEQQLPHIISQLRGKDTVIFMDPPRQGLHRSVRQYIRQAQKQVKECYYLSCHPPTLMRDLKDLCYGNLWRVVSIQPFDMFPRTKHIECLVILQ